MTTRRRSDPEAEASRVAKRRDTIIARYGSLHALAVQVGAKAKAANLAGDPNYYVKIGKLGGETSRGGGFADRELASRAGRLGGAAGKGKKRKPE